jgi:hypothetical protein
MQEANICPFCSSETIYVECPTGCGIDKEVFLNCMSKHVEFIVE